MNKQQKKVFSVASKYNEIYEILQNVPNQSEFICQAIIEKYKRDNNIGSIDDKYLDDRIRKILSEMVTDDHILVAYRGKSPVANMEIRASDIPADVEDVETVTSDDDMDDIKAAISGW